MGVMACDRTGCNHIMCERLILNGSSYICEDCWDELLVEKAKWPSAMSAKDVRDSIKEFMDSQPGTGKILDSAGIDEEFRRLTGEKD